MAVNLLQLTARNKPWTNRPNLPAVHGYCLSGEVIRRTQDVQTPSSLGLKMCFSVRPGSVLELRIATEQTPRHPPDEECKSLLGCDQ